MAMVKNKQITFSIVLVCLIVVSPMAKAQLNLGGLLGGVGGLVTGAGGLVSGSGGLVTGTGGLVTGAGGLVTGAGGLVTGAGGLVTGAGGLVTGAGGLVTGAGGLVNGVGGLVSGAGGLVSGVGGLVGGVGGLVTGAGGLVRLISIPSIQGIVFCTHNGRISPNTRSTPAFPNAGVELQCGKQNKVVSSTTTNAAGIFSIPTNSNQILLSTLLSGCKLAVKTPLTNCNANLPSVGSLVSPLTVIGTTVFGGVLNIVNLAPTGFLLITT